MMSSVQAEMIEINKVTGQNKDKTKPLKEESIHDTTI